MPGQKQMLILAALALLTASNANATWSVAALNEETRTIAVAGASCSYMVYGIATVTPGKGVVLVQAASNAQARATAASMLANGESLQNILKHIRNDEYAQVPWLTLAVYGIEPGTRSAVDELLDLFDRWRKEGQSRPSTQIYLIP